MIFTKDNIFDKNNISYSQGLDQLNESFNEGSDDESRLLNTVIKTSNSLTNLCISNDTNSNANWSDQRNTVRKPVHDRGDNYSRKKPVSDRGARYCKREPLFPAPGTQELVSEKCDLCGMEVDDLVLNSSELICKSCNKLSKELDSLFIDRSENVTAEVTKRKERSHFSDKVSSFQMKDNSEDSYFSASSNKRENRSNKTENTIPKPAVPKERPTFRNKNNSHQNIDEMIYKLRQSSLHRNPKVNVHNIPFSAKTKDLKSDKVLVNNKTLPFSAKGNDWKDNSLISSDESFIEPEKGIIKSEFQPSDLSSITLEDSDIDSTTVDFIGLIDKRSASTVKLKEDSGYRKINTVPMSRFHDSDMSTITEVTEPDNTELTLMKNSAHVNHTNNAFGTGTNSKVLLPQRTEKTLNDKGANKDQYIPDILVTDIGNDNVIDSGQDFVDLWDEVRAQTMRSKNMLNTGFFRRDSLISYASDATTVEYVYTDPENGIALLERHIPSVCGSVGSRRSSDSQFSLNSQQSDHRNSDVSYGESDNTEIYDWREEAMCEGFGVKDEVDTMKTPTNKPDLNKLNNKAIRFV